MLAQFLLERMAVDQAGQLIEVRLLEQDLRALNIGDGDRKSVGKIIELLRFAAFERPIGSRHQRSGYHPICSDRQTGAHVVAADPGGDAPVAILIAQAVVGNFQQADGILNQLPVLKPVSGQGVLFLVQAQEQRNLHSVHACCEQDFADHRVEIGGRENQTVDVRDRLTGLQRSLKLIGHLVEGIAQRLELIVRLHGHPLAIVAPANPAG